MKNDIIMGQFIIEKHGKREANACFGDNATLLCPECFSENVFIEDSKIEKYTLKKGIIFEKVCSSRKVRCFKCDCEFRQLGNDVQKVKKAGRRIDISSFLLRCGMILMILSGLVAVLAVGFESEKVIFAALAVFLIAFIITIAGIIVDWRYFLLNFVACVENIVRQSLIHSKISKNKRNKLKLKPCCNEKISNLNFVSFVSEENL